MKLAMCCVAVWMVACADVETNGGGQGEGIKPDKIEFQPDPSTEPLPFNPVVSGLQQKAPASPANDICDGCTITAFVLPPAKWGLDEVRIASLGDVEVCRIYLDQSQVIINECGTLNP